MSVFGRSPAICTILLIVGTAAAQTTYNISANAPGDPATHALAEAAYLTDLAGGGYGTFFEGFESAAWDGVRSTVVGGYHTAPSITNGGITWTTNPGDVITTSNQGSTSNPDWQIYGKGTDPGEFHSVPGTLIGQSDRTLYGMGFWISGGPPGKGKINVILDDTTVVEFKQITGYENGDPEEPIKDPIFLGSAKVFFGLLEPVGFTKFEILELEGMLEDQVLVWADSFTFAVTQLAGDFDNDGDVDANDADLLCANLGDAAYDLDGDGDADEGDWVVLIEQYIEWDNGTAAGTGTFRGDFNLDGEANGTDLSIMNATFGTGVGFAGGNANCDATVNGTDLSILAGVFGSVATSAVPEPMTITLLSLSGLAILRRRNR